MNICCIMNCFLVIQTEGTTIYRTRHRYVEICHTSLIIYCAMMTINNHMRVSYLIVTQWLFASITRKIYMKRLVVNTLWLPLPWASGLPVAIQCAWNLDPSVHWNATGEIIVGSQCVSSVLPVVFQWSSSVFQLCKLTLDHHWDTNGC